MRKIYIILAAAFALLTISCEEVMEDFSLKNSDPKLVIEANCTSFNDSVIVYLSKTADYLNPVEYPTVSDASIVLVFEDTSIAVNEIEPGKYVAKHSFKEGIEYW